MEKKVSFEGIAVSSGEKVKKPKKEKCLHPLENSEVYGYTFVTHKATGRCSLCGADGLSLSMDYDEALRQGF